MAERTGDLDDVLRAAEAQREAALLAVPTDGPLTRVRASVRATRTRRAALAATGAAAAIVVVGAVALWSPRPSPAPAAPTTTSPTTTSPAPTTPAVTPRATGTPAAQPTPVEVGGLPPLLPAGADELLAAPVGSVLALWTPTTLSELSDGSGPQEVHVVLVAPDGVVRHVTRAPDGAVEVVAWDRAAATAVVITAEGGGDGATLVVDLLTGATTPAAAVPRYQEPTSPDGTATARVEGSTVSLTAGDDVRALDLPSRWCALAGWSDATHLLLSCTDRAPTSLVPAEADRPALLLLDTVTGAMQQQALTTGDVVPTGVQGVLLDDGALVAPVDVIGREVDENEVGRVCGTGLGRFSGLEGVALPAVPAGDLTYPGLVAAPGRLLVAGPTFCATDLATSGLWSLDLATGRVDELLPVDDGLDAPYGLLSWTTWR
ncbi:hypothetical protein [Cellulomonas sp. S1-8]|uniref:hypothetical protein n=1 Tax=Cellulomonas sp. S1-8 TaxID=2904790 RepID=UPI002243F44C|nr:hypothetical protein [Cellulomonas sp. S1-8]UZN03355.1 hypothetical protein OKX07_20275 [Cellulomonas sp. S1-8]